jgi:3-oxoacyl-[acyl-carrier-protein] synthase-1
VVAGVDTYLVAETLTSFVERRRVQTALNLDGFIPGEAAAAILLGPATAALRGSLTCVGMGFGTEPAPLQSGLPLRADGLVTAIKAALAEAGLNMAQLDYRITDLSGEHYGFKEAALAQLRVLRARKEELDIWHPADCIGEVGAATLPVLFAVAGAAAKKGYAPGPRALCHIAADDGRRAAFIFAENGRAA